MEPRVLRHNYVEWLTRSGKASIYRQMQIEPFPMPLKFGKRAVAWRTDKMQEWIASRPRVTGDVIRTKSIE